MDARCAKCGRQREGDHYKLYVAKKEGEQFKFTFTELRTEDVFICNSCARAGKSGIHKVVLVLFALFSLPLFGAGIGAMSVQGFGAGVGSFVIGLVLLIPAAWAGYALVTARPTRENGEYAAAGARFKALQSEGASAIAAPEMKQLTKLHPELSMLLLTAGLPGLHPRPASLDESWRRRTPRESDVTENDLQDVKDYCHQLAVEWWDTVDFDSVMCDVCGQRAVPRGFGWRVGSWMYCFPCADKTFSREALIYLRQDPDFFGQGVLRKARAFAAREQPIPY